MPPSVKSTSGNMSSELFQFYVALSAIITVAIVAALYVGKDHSDTTDL